MSIDEIPFEQVLDALFSDGPVSISMLFRLSDAPAEDLLAFKSRYLEQTDERRRVIMRHLADLTEENFRVDFSPIFTFSLQDDYAEVRLAALDGLWDNDNPALIQPIISLMENDAETRVRALAAATLGHYILMSEWGQFPSASADQAVDSLLAQWDMVHNEPAVRRSALESLGCSSHPRIRKLISEAYDSGNMDMQLSAVFAMGRSADPRWMDLLIDEMSSSDWEMRLEAARAAGEIGDPEAIPLLADLIYDEEVEVRLAAITALGRVGGDRSSEILSQLAEDPEAEPLYEAIDQALDEMDWLGGEFDFSSLSWPEEDEDDEWGGPVS